MPGGRGGGGGGGGGGSRAPISRDVQISKKLSWLLRHHAEQEGLRLDAHGFVSMQDVLDNRNFRSLKVTFDEIRRIVEENDKQRFSMVPVQNSSSSSALPEQSNGVKGSGIGDEVADGIPNGPQTALPSDKPKDWLIRANQGHSLKVESDGLLQPITTSNMPGTAVHGTTHAAWIQIVASGGLKPMKRNHVHFASGLPAGFASIADDKSSAAGEGTEKVAAPVISGMRNSSTVLVWLDVRKAMDAGLKFWRSENGVILTEGGEDGMVSLEFVKRVEDRTGEGVLVEDGKVVKEAPKGWEGKSKGRGRG